VAPVRWLRRIAGAGWFDRLVEPELQAVAARSAKVGTRFLAERMNGPEDPAIFRFLGM
jgi:hypothetical protein